MAELTPQGIATALGKARRQGKDWQCLCPGHNDHNPSLSLTTKNGRLLVKCRAGCDQTTVISALHRLGLWPDKADGNAQPRPKPREVAAYNFRDAEGKLRY